MGSRLLYAALELWHWNCTTLWIFDEVGFAIYLFLGFYDRLPITDQKKMIEYQNKAIHVKKQKHAVVSSLQKYRFHTFVCLS